MKRTILTLTGTVFASCILASAVFAQQSDSKPPTNVVKLQVIDSNWMPWEMLGIPQINAKIPIKALQADAERYRWLRQRNIEHYDDSLPAIACHRLDDGGWGKWQTFVYDEPDEIDAAIDAARKAAP